MLGVEKEKPPEAHVRVVLKVPCKVPEFAIFSVKLRVAGRLESVFSHSDGTMLIPP